MVTGTVEAISSILVAAEKVKVVLDDRADMGSLTGFLEGSNVGIPKGALIGFPIEDTICGD